MSAGKEKNTRWAIIFNNIYIYTHIYRRVPEESVRFNTSTKRGRLYYMVDGGCARVFKQIYGINIRQRLRQRGIQVHVRVSIINNINYTQRCTVNL